MASPRALAHACLVACLVALAYAGGDGVVDRPEELDRPWLTDPRLAGDPVAQANALIARCGWRLSRL